MNAVHEEKRDIVRKLEQEMDKQRKDHNKEIDKLKKRWRAELDEERERYRSLMVEIRVERARDDANRLVAYDLSSLDESHASEFSVKVSELNDKY